MWWYPILVGGIGLVEFLCMVYYHSLANAIAFGLCIGVLIPWVAEKVTSKWV